MQQLYIFFLEFQADGFLLPITQACTTILLQKAGARYASSSPPLPSLEFLSILSTVFHGVDKLKTLYYGDFFKILSEVPNAHSGITSSSTNR